MVKMGNTSLIAYAARFGSKPIVRKLLALGARENSEDNIASPLHIACMGGHVDIVHLLLCHDSGATKDLKWQEQAGDWFVPLGLAATHGHAAIVELLLKFGADVETNHGELNALIWAARFGHTATIELLLQFGANIEARRGGSALIMAAMRGHEATVRLLLGFGADPKRTDTNGCTARYHAQKAGHLRIVEIFDELSRETRDTLSVPSQVRHTSG